MTITHSYTKLVAVAAGVAVAFALVLGAAAPVRAAALTSTQVNAIVSLLQSFGADAATIANVQASLTGTAPTMPTTPSTGGSMACNASVWTRDLTVGSTGADVMALQKFLNMSAATQVAATGAGSPGMETSTFGPATRAAVIKFQTANAITPAAGYVGPVTRTAIAAKCGSTPTTPGTPGKPTTPAGLQGGEGSVDNIDSLGDVDTSVDEGQNDVKVLGAEFDAKDSDILIERVDVDISTHSGNGSANLTNYVDSVSLWLDGKKIGTVDADEVKKDSSNVYSFRFSGLKGIVREGDTANLYVSLDVVNNLDSTDDADTWAVLIPQNGIRAVDAAGISETYVTSAESTTLTQTVTFNTANRGTLTLSAGSNNPLAGLVVVDDVNETQDVSLLEVKVKASNSDVTIHDFPIGLAAATGNVNVIVKRVHLMQGSTVLKTESIPSAAAYNAITFDNIDYEINEGETVTFKVVADIFDTDSGEPDNGDTLVASTTGALTGWDAEDTAGDTLTESTHITGSVAGNTQTFYGSNGIDVNFTSASTVKTPGAIAGAPDSVEYTIKFSVKNLGETTVYFDGDVAVGGVIAAAGTISWATTTDSSTGTTTGNYGFGTGIVTADVSDSNDVLNSNDKRFEIESGETRNFTFKVTINAGGDNVAAGVKLTGFSWDTTSQDATANLYDFDLGAFKTDTLTGLSIQ